MRGRRAIKDEQHVPTRRADVDIGGRCDGTVIASARHMREEDPISHRVAMGARGSSDKGDLHVCRRTLEEVDGNLVGLTILPIRMRDGVCGLGPPISQIGRVVDLDSEFLRVYCNAVDESLRVRSGNKDSTVVNENRLGVVHTGDDGRAELGDALIHGKGWIVEESSHVWIARQPEASDALQSTVQDEESAIWKSNHASHHTRGRLEGVIIWFFVVTECCGLTMRSMVHVGSVASGWMLIQLSSAL